VAIAGPLKIESELEDGRGRLTLAGELDIATVPRLQEAVEALLAHEPRELVVDLRTLGFLDSSGLRQFIVLADRAGEEGWTLVLVRPTAPVLSIFQITRAEEHLPFVDEPPSP
jgi:anti-sigma B factor antagonist